GAGGEAGEGGQPAGTCGSETSQKQEAPFGTEKSPKAPALPLPQGGTGSPATINASRRSRFSSACSSADERLGLRGTRMAVQHTAMLSKAASGPRGRAIPTREAVPIPAVRN